MAGYSTFPHTPKLDVAPFKVAIPDDDLAELKALLKAGRVGPKTPQNTEGSHRLGVSHDWLTETKHYWQSTFDWRKQEARINAFPQYKTSIPIEIAGSTYSHSVHFAALFSKKRDAIPLILLHGWPGSFIEFLPILELLQSRFTPETLPYHVVVPSLPGYGFSSPPQTEKFKMKGVAKVFNELMLGLGFDKYIAQGGDVGSNIGRLMAQEYSACKALHLNMFSAKPVEGAVLPQDEQAGVDRGTEWRKLAQAYGHEHATRPNTIGLVLSSSPIALLAWIGEKWVEWSDATPAVDDILTDISIYWFTNSIATSLYPYNEGVSGGAGFQYIKPPVGFSWFPGELFPTPEAWIKPEANLVFYRKHKNGGHFAAIELPEILLQDIDDFITQVSPGIFTNKASL